MNRRVWSALAVVASFSLASLGQSKAAEKTEAAKAATGEVTGHVYCADTDAPARFASVTLQPIEAVIEDPSKDGRKDANKDASKDVSKEAGNHAAGDANGTKAPVQYRTPDSFEVSMVRTSLDGSFTIEKVKPGTYFVVAEQPGYISPMAEFPMQSGERLTEEVLLNMGKLLQRITVEANQTVQVEERMERGAAVSGSVSFDDGSPAPGLNLQLMRKKKDGAWENVAMAANRSVPLQVTDDLGRFRMPGLPAAEYMVKITLQMAGMTIRKSRNSTGASGGQGFSLSFFSGGTTREKDAASFKLTDGEERAGEDTVIPISKLHRVTGTLISARDGHVINAGQLSLRYSDGTEVATAEVTPDQPAFIFEFVPEGDYVLSVPYALDVVVEDNPLQPGQPRAYTASGIDLENANGITQKDLQLYEDKEQPVSIKGETSGLVVSLSERHPAARQGTPAPPG